MEVRLAGLGGAPTGGGPHFTYGADWRKRTAGGFASLPAMGDRAAHRTDTAPAPPAHVRGPGTGARLWLVRHAEVHEDWQGVAYGDLDVPLSEVGRRQTASLIERLAALAPRAVLSSPLERALALGRGLAEASGAPLTVADGLREIDRGAWQGARVEELHAARAEEVAAFYADPWSWRGHGGECDADVAARAWPVVEAALAAPGSGDLVVVSHYNVIRVTAGRMLGIPPERTFALRVDPGSAVALVDGPRGFVLHHSNVDRPPADFVADHLP